MTAAEDVDITCSRASSAIRGDTQSSEVHEQRLSITYQSKELDEARLGMRSTSAQFEFGRIGTATRMKACIHRCRSTYTRLSHLL